MNRQDSNDRVSRVVRISKDVARSLDAYAVRNGLMIREVIDAALSDFLEASAPVQRLTLERWRNRGKVRPATNRESDLRAPKSLTEWRRLCSAEGVRIDPAQESEE